jgi:hypothetical protein
MSGYDLVIAVEEAPHRSTGEQSWLARWLSEALGVRTGVVAWRDPVLEDDAPAMFVCYGAPEFQRGVVARRPDAVCFAPHQGEWLRLALRWLHHDETPAECPGEACIDRGLRALTEAVDSRFPSLARPLWPNGHSCAVLLTHDIDSVDRWSAGHVRHLARHAGERFRREGVKSVIRIPWAAARGMWDRQDVGGRLQRVVAIEREADARATYLFFSPETRYRRAWDGWYSPETTVGGRPLGALWDSLVSTGFEVGLHLSIGAHDDADAIAGEWRALRSSVEDLATCRSHYLKTKPGVTADALHAAGARVELNLVTNGFSRGTGLPFVLRDGAPALYRLPTVLSDAELQTHGAEPDVQERLWSRWQLVLDEAHQNRSAAAILLHPENPGADAMVERVVAWCRLRKAWMPTAMTLIEHWQARGTG